MLIARLVPLCTLLIFRSPPLPPTRRDRSRTRRCHCPACTGPARILRDVDGMPHIYAFDEHDAAFLQGWVTAQDRLFQIDVLRRQSSGTLAELLGSGALPSDIELRTVGLRRAAERSLCTLFAGDADGAAGVRRRRQRVGAARRRAARAVRRTRDHAVHAVDRARQCRDRQGARVPAVVRHRRRTRRWSTRVPGRSRRSVPRCRTACSSATCSVRRRSTRRPPSPTRPMPHRSSARSARPRLQAPKAGAAASEGTRAGKVALDASAATMLRNVKRRYEARAVPEATRCSGPSCRSAATSGPSPARARRTAGRWSRTTRT